MAVVFGVGIAILLQDAAVAAEVVIIDHSWRVPLGAVSAASWREYHHNCPTTEHPVTCQSQKNGRLISVLLKGPSVQTEIRTPFSMTARERTLHAEGADSA
jgi:hypothetical protein